MAWTFCDSFDLYAAFADMLNYWDSTVGTIQAFNAGRFGASRAIMMNSTSGSTKNSGANDAVHHIFCSFEGTTSSSGGAYFTLMDGATAQCTILFQTNGNILLQSGAVGGATLATYAAGLQLNVWYGFEFEVVINNTTGSWAVRKNGNPANDFQATGLDTQQSANAYANALKMGASINGGSNIDDLFWQSGSLTGTWLGELRCLTRMPTSDASAQFSKGLTSYQLSTSASTGANTTNNTSSYYIGPFTPTYDGSVGSLTISVNAGFTGNMKCSLFADAAGVPGALLGSATTVSNPATGNQPVTFPTPVPVTRSVLFWVGVAVDGAYTNALNYRSAAGKQYGIGYAAFPVSNPASGGLLANNFGPAQTFVTFTIANDAALVNEAQQDGLTTYVYDANPGDQDFYGLPAGSTFTSTPYSTVAVITRGFMQKSDAGSRTAAVSVKSGATTVASPTLTLTNSGWQWAWRQDLTDPNTSAAWTSAAVDALQVGPTVVA